MYSIYLIICPLYYIFLLYICIYLYIYILILMSLLFVLKYIYCEPDLKSTIKMHYELNIWKWGPLWKCKKYYSKLESFFRILYIPFEYGFSIAVASCVPADNRHETAHYDDQYSHFTTRTVSEHSLQSSIYSRSTVCWRKQLQMLS